jgi:predicted house-cleaning noncanonical NTP pyrophosphatase (MazG superfamily)
MAMKKYNKLVRDKMPGLMEGKGVKQVTHIANDAEYWLKLREKLIEEVNEFLESEELEEIADVFEVIDAICEFKKFDREQLADIKSKKKSERGGFTERIILDEAEEH